MTLSLTTSKSYFQIPYFALRFMIWIMMPLYYKVAYDVHTPCKTHITHHCILKILMTLSNKIIITKSKYQPLQIQSDW